MAADSSFSRQIELPAPSVPHGREGESEAVRGGQRRTLGSFYVRSLLAVCGGRGKWGRLAVFVLATLVHALGHAALALVAGRCAVVLAGTMLNSAGPLGKEATATAALTLGALGAAAALAKAVGGVVATHGQARIAAQVGGLLRMEVLDGWFESYGLRQPRQFDHGQCVYPPPTGGSATTPLANRRAAKGVSALTDRVREVEQGLAHGVLAGSRAVAQLVPLLVALVWISPTLALSAVGVLAPFSWLLSSLRRTMRRTHAAAARDSEDMLEAVDEAVRHADLWVAYSAESKARATVEDLGDSLGRRASRLEATVAAMSGGNEVLAAMSLVVALAMTRAGWFGNVEGGGRLLAFAVCFFLAYRPLRDLAEARVAWSRAQLAFDELGRVCVPCDAPRSAQTEPLRALAGRSWSLDTLRIEGLVLRRGMRPAISFVVEPGEVVVVVGATGRGKTTLLRTLAGLEPELEGDVFYGSDRLSGAPPGLAHRPFAWVPQDSPLLAATLEANVSLGAPADSLAVLQGLGAHRLAADATGRRIGAGGLAMSGGERQWIALARALATTQPVLLLDEPTSGLDVASERGVIAALSALRGRRSILLVTHRPELVELADVVVHLEADAVRVENGPVRGRGGPAAPSPDDDAPARRDPGRDGCRMAGGAVRGRAPAPVGGPLTCARN